MTVYLQGILKRSGGEKDGVEILCSEAHQEEVLASLTRLENMIGEGKFAKKDVKPTILEDFTDVPMQNTENIFEELLARGIIRKITEGVYAYSDIFLKGPSGISTGRSKRTGSNSFPVSGSMNSRYCIRWSPIRPEAILNRFPIISCSSH